MYLTPTNQHWACDIEADGLLDTVSKIWCVVCVNVITKEIREFTDKDAFNAWYLETKPLLVGHNFIAYDLIVLNRLWNSRIGIRRIVDTFVLSQLYHPTYPRPKNLARKKGAHSLEAWGLRLRYPKSEHDDFSKFSPEMLHYCRRDTILTAFLFRKLTERMRQVGFTEFGAEIEHLAWNIIQNKQRKNGFPLDKKRAIELYVRLRTREEELKNEIYRLWPPQLKVVKTCKQALKKDGEGTKNFLIHRGQYPEIRMLDDGGYECLDYVAFNLGSPAQRLGKLRELGYEPVGKTKKGNPKVDEDELLAIAEQSGKKELVALAKWVVINSRANNVKTWLDAYDEKTGAVHGQLFIASTLRYRHSNPNSANIPSVRLKKVVGPDGQDKDEVQYGEDGAYSYECRDLWTCGEDREGWNLVGIDGKGIQLRVLANYAYSDEFVARVLDGDPHSNNIKVLGLANKAAAKKFLYTTLMGGGGARLAADQAQFGSKFSSSEGMRLKALLVDSIPGFHDLIKRLEKELEETGRIRLCDGTPILVPSPHMVIPYLLQGDESRLMKLAMIYVDEIIRKERWENDVFKVADIHDEWQFRCRASISNDFIRAALPCFERAGKAFNYRIPIEGDAKVGKTWAETH